MDLQDQLQSDRNQYFCHRLPAEFDTSANHHLLCSELRSGSARLEGNPDPYCNIWTDGEQTRVKSSNTRSFVADARIRLDNLKSGCNTPLPGWSTDGLLCNYNCQKDIRDREEPQEEKSALDLVELLDVEDDVQDEESWLYESPKKPDFHGGAEPALTWCRRVLDNPSPEMEAACQLLIHKLDQKSSSHLYRCPTVSQHTGNVSVDSYVDKTSVSAAHNTSNSLDNSELNVSHDSTSYRLQDITDVHIMARIQEASLRQDYVSTPASSSAKRHSESPVMLPSYDDDLTSGNKTKASPSSRWQPGVSTSSSSFCQTPTSAAKQGCQSPKLARLRQQVTQFKLLKLAHDQAAAPGRTRSPLRTSLRSLQAVRNSRSLEPDDCQPTDQNTSPASGASSTGAGLSSWSPSPSAASTYSNGSTLSVRDSSVRTTAMKRLQRSQSSSPCRIPHPAKGYLSLNGRVFASPERSTSVAWARNVLSTQK